MIKTPFALFQVQIESFFRHAVELLQATFGIRPETFDAVDMRIAGDKLILRVIDAVMFIKADIDQTVVAAPAVRMNDRVQRNTPANNVLQRFSLHVRHDFGKHKAALVCRYRRGCVCRLLRDRVCRELCEHRNKIRQLRLPTNRKAKPLGKQQKVECEFSKRWSWWCAAKYRSKEQCAKHSNLSRSNEREAEIASLQYGNADNSGLTQTYQKFSTTI